MNKKEDNNINCIEYTINENNEGILEPDWGGRGSNNGKGRGDGVSNGAGDVGGKYSSGALIEDLKIKLINISDSIKNSFYGEV